MKLLMFYVHEWWYKTASKSLSSVADVSREARLENAAVVFYHVEAEDQEKSGKVIQKFTKNIKWIAGKFSTKNIVLHSFNHLGISKAPPEFSKEVVDEVIERLERTGFTVMTTPFGYFNEFKMHVAGDSLAKVYKEF